jgi:hypothetical protein
MAMFKETFREKSVKRKKKSEGFLHKIIDVKSEKPGETRAFLV